MDKVEIILVACILLIVAAVFNLGNLYGQRGIKQQAITHNYAQYNPQTGSFEWLEEVGE